MRLEQAGKEVPDELERAPPRRTSRCSRSCARARPGRGAFCQRRRRADAAEVIEFFHAIGMPPRRALGHVGDLGVGDRQPAGQDQARHRRPAGRPASEIKLAEDGEILVRARLVMPGYRNNPEKTKETIDDDGWLSTGDIGEFDEDGYLKIVDRKKELIINAAGKNMSPANIEAKLKSAGPLIGQAIAVGDGRPYNVALIVLDPDNAPGWAKQAASRPTSLEDIVEDEKVIEAVGKGVEAANEKMARVEQIKKFKILPTEWEPGGDELTPTMKLKRKPIGEKYKDGDRGALRLRSPPPTVVRAVVTRAGGRYREGWAAPCRGSLEDLGTPPADGPASVGSSGVSERRGVRRQTFASRRPSSRSMSRDRRRPCRPRPSRCPAGGSRRERRSPRLGHAP